MPWGVLRAPLPRGAAACFGLVFFHDDTRHLRAAAALPRATGTGAVAPTPVGTEPGEPAVFLFTMALRNDGMCAHCLFVRGAPVEASCRAAAPLEF